MVCLLSLIPPNYDLSLPKKAAIGDGKAGGRGVLVKMGFAACGDKLKKKQGLGLGSNNDGEKKGDIG